MSNTSKRPKSAHTPTKRSGDNRTRTLVVVASVTALIVIVGVVVALAVGGGDDDKGDAGRADVTVQAGDFTSSGVAVCADAEPAEPSGDAPELDQFRPNNIYKPVAVQGDALPQFSADLNQALGADPAQCMPAPIVSGYDYLGNEITVDAGQDGPTMVVLLAHWCPHCNNEIPVLNDLRDDFPEELNVVGVSTSVSPDSPNFPPDQWLVDKDWQWPVLADGQAVSEQQGAPAFTAFGGSSFPTMILVGSDGLVRYRVSGEVPAETISALIDEFIASDSAA